MHPKGSSGGGSCRCEGTEQLRNKLQTAHRTLIVDMEGVRVLSFYLRGQRAKVRACARPWQLSR